LSRYHPLIQGKKNAHKKQKIYDLLKNHIQLYTYEIYCALNKQTKNGVTMNEVTNLLARTPLFENIGFTSTCNHYSRVRLCVWGLNYELQC
jgi:hypothetical protein